MKPWWQWKWLDLTMLVIGWLCVLGMVVSLLGLIVVWTLGIG